jgi:hypothetical protein
MTFDIKKLAIKDMALYHVTDAAGNPQYFDAEETQPVTITVYSPGTRKAAAAEFKRNEARSARVIGAMGGKTSKRTEVDEVNERANFLAEIAGQLNGWEYPGGAKALYQDLTLGHIANGVETFYNERGNFIADSATNFPSMSATPLG